MATPKTANGPRGLRKATRPARGAGRVRQDRSPSERWFLLGEIPFVGSPDRTANRTSAEPAWIILTAAIVTCSSYTRSMLVLIARSSVLGLRLGVRPHAGCYAAFTSARPMIR